MVNWVKSLFFTNKSKQFFGLNRKHKTMNMKYLAATVLVSVLAVFFVVAAHAVTIDTVTIGNPNNAADTTTGYGSVAEMYAIGKYEITSGQYCEFLNAVAHTDNYGLYHPYMWSSDYGCKIQQTGSSGSFNYSVAADWADRPVNWVSWGDAARFCNWINNNQPTGADPIDDRGRRVFPQRQDEQCGLDVRNAQEQCAMVDSIRERVVQGCVPQERRHNGQLFPLSDKQQYDAEQ